ncbi:MAG: hypothetical protein IT195_02265 [Microthrixaceae bacterium]|nr:hypothetical protein [Microthrixaceae bacterium]
MPEVEVTVEELPTTIAGRVARRLEAGGVKANLRRSGSGIRFELSSDELTEGDLRAVLARTLVQIVGHFDGFAAVS